MLKLIIEDDEGRKTVVPFVRDEITIGRQEGNTIRLTERNVSRHHARLTRNNGHVIIEDLGSFNGIRINGDKIKGQVQVGDGDLIQIGDYDLALHAEQATHVDGATTPLELMPTRRLPERPATTPDLPARDTQSEDTQVGREPAPGSSKDQSTAVIRMEQIEPLAKRPVVNLDLSEAPRLVVLNTDLSGREFLCNRTEMRVGRTEENDIALDHRSLSRTHCKIVREASGEWRVIDLQSANGLLVNGETYAQVALQSGDIIELGHVKLKFLAPGETASSLLAFESNPTTQLKKPAPAGLPRLAVLGAVLVLLVGGGGYLWLKSQSQSVEQAAPELATPAPTQVSSDALRKEAQQKLDQAKAAAVALEWQKATQLAQEAQQHKLVAPAAEQFLARLESERKHAETLEDATRSLNSGNLDKAKTQLDAAAPTQLFGQHYDSLVTRYSAMRAEQTAKEEAAKAPKAPPVTVAKVDPRLTDAERLYREAAEEKKAKNLEKAAARLEKCIKTLPTYHPCYRLAGSVFASIATRDQSAPDMEKARKYYERFLDVAPPDDEYVPKVRAILEQAKNQ